MSPENVEKVMKKYEKKIPKYCESELKRALNHAPDDAFGRLMIARFNKGGGACFDAVMRDIFHFLYKHLPIILAIGALLLASGFVCVVSVPEFELYWEQFLFWEDVRLELNILSYLNYWLLDLAERIPLFSGTLADLWLGPLPELFVVGILVHFVSWVLVVVDLAIIIKAVVIYIINNIKQMNYDNIVKALQEEQAEGDASKEVAEECKPKSK